MPPLHAFLILDQFAAQVIAAADPLRYNAPFVVIRQNAESHKCTIFACSDSAMRMRIHPGDSLEMVRKKYPAIEVKERSVDLERTALDELSHIIETCTPQYHVSENGVCWMNLTGTPIQRELLSAECGACPDSAMQNQWAGAEHESLWPAVRGQPLDSEHGPKEPRLSIKTQSQQFSANKIDADDHIYYIKYQHIIRHNIINKIKHRLNLGHIAVGLGPSRIVARMMAHLALPESIRICRLEDEPRIVPTLSIRLLPGLSFATRDRLAKYGIHTIGQLRQLTRNALITRLGKEGEKVFYLAMGIDACAQPQSESLLWSEVVLERDINDMEILTRRLHYAVDQLCHQLSERGFVTDNLLLILRYSDGKSAQKTARLSPATGDFLRLCGRASRLLAEVCQRRVAIRSIRVIAKRPAPQTGQLDLFETAWERKQMRLSAGITRVRKKTSFFGVMTASHLGNS